MLIQNRSTLRKLQFDRPLHSFTVPGSKYTYIQEGKIENSGFLQDCQLPVNYLTYYTCDDSIDE